MGVTSFANSDMTSDTPRVLIVAEHASAKFGGEAALPLHYFRVLRKRQIEVWLVVHERTRDELKLYFAADFDRICFVADTVQHRLLWKLSRFFPHRLAYFTVGFVSRLVTQFVQRRLIRQMVQQHQITIIHQPTPVSPKEPSLICDLGVPVIMGPMNGGMDYPAAFQCRQGWFVHLTLISGRLFSNWLNALIPGKHRAAALLVANVRTKAALPKGACDRVIELHENGVDLAVWQPSAERGNVQLRHLVESMAPQTARLPLVKFVYVGRLVHWKAVDLLLLAFRRVAEQLPVELEIIGDGARKVDLKRQARALGLLQFGDQLVTSTSSNEPTPLKGSVRFLGWLAQADCARRLQQADVMVLPSLLECGGAVVLESMAMAIPVIATNWGGPTDYLDDTCGILIEPRSQALFIDDLAAAMIRMASSSELRRSMGEAGRQRVLRYFDWDKKAETILEIYRNVLASTLTQHQCLPHQKGTDGAVKQSVKLEH